MCKLKYYVKIISFYFVLSPPSTGIRDTVEDSAVRNMLEQFKVTLCSDIKNEKIRNATTHRMTEILNGNRFLNIKPLKEGEYLPRTCTCTGITCSHYHKGKPTLKRTPKCTKCWSTDRFTYQCEDDKCCKFCKKPGHLPGEKTCEYYIEEDPTIIPFSGKDNTLSNFYPADIKVFGIQHKSSEHAYQYVKAMRSGDVPRATAIQEAPSALDAKLIGNKVLASENFINSQYDIMKEIVEAKVSQCREFHDVLKNVPPKAVFVGST